MDDLIRMLDVRELTTRLVAFLPDLFAAVMILVTFWILFRVTRGSLKSILRRVGFHETLARMLVDSVYHFTLLIIALVMAADQVGINVGAALAGIGVVGLAVSFAAQDSLANIISGFLVFIDKPFLVGDWVQVAGQYGRVTSITMRSTRIRTNNNTYVIIPNKTIINEVLVNHSQNGEIRIDIPVGIAYGEDIARAREAIIRSVRGIEGVRKDPPPDVVVTGLGPSSVNLDVRVWIDPPERERPIFFKVMEASKSALDTAGIEIPYPRLQLIIENVDARVWEGASRLAR